MAHGETSPLPGSPRPAGGRRHSRPRTIEPCVRCGAPAGYNYGSCAACTNSIEGIWYADWSALLAAEGIEAGSDDELLLARLVLAEEARHPWTVVDGAMLRLRCDACGGELGGGPLDCDACELAFRNLFAYDFEALPAGVMTPNEHALRVNRWVLRYPHRHSAPEVFARREVTPLLLTGVVPTTREAQAMAARSKARFNGSAGSAADSAPRRGNRA